MRFQNPKTHVHDKDVWYDFYADFSPKFVEAVLDHSDPSQCIGVLDPWNGSGTTTQIAEDRGFCSYGFDINPAMVLVARARRIDPDCSTNLLGLCNDIVKKAQDYKYNTVVDADLLSQWLTKKSVSIIRNLEQAIQRLLLNKDYEPLSKRQNLNDVNSLVSLFYVCLCQAVREIISPFRSSNPTWIKIPRSSDEVLSVDKRIILKKFRKHILRTISMLEKRKQAREIQKLNKTVIDIASSTSLPIFDNSVDLIVSSPPYCTRIDYAVATRPELAVLGFSKDQIDLLRDQTIGTTTIYNKDLEINPNWGKLCHSFLDSVLHHMSKASDTYYYPTFLQYFSSMYKSLEEINRVLSDNGLCVLVLQDSYYKDVHNNLPGIISEMVCTFNWSLDIKEDFPINQTMAGINRGTRKYRSASNAVESVLVFRK